MLVRPLGFENVLPKEMRLAGAESVDHLLAAKALVRYARTTSLDSSAIEKLRKDLLALLKNIPKIQTPEDAQVVSAACKVFRKKFDTLFFEHFLNRDLKYEDNGLSESDREYIGGKLRKSGWDLYLALQMPYGDNFSRFQEEKQKWSNRVKAKARAFWKEFDESREYYERLTKSTGFPVKVPDHDQTTIEGFKVTMVGWGQDTTSEEDLADRFARFKEGLKIFRRRAGQALPMMLKVMLPLTVYAYIRKLDEGASYEVDHIDVSMGASTKNPASMAHLVAHEMGHHLYRTYLSKADREFWDTAIRGNYGPLDVEKALRLWPEGAWLFDMPQHMKDIDPTLAVQLQVLSQLGGERGPQTKEEFQKAVDAGEIFTVPKNPISGYAAKNTEEAFCEAIGFLVGYGPRTVDPLVLSWLRLILPSVKVAARTHYRPAENAAINLLVQSPDATVDELVRQVRDFDMDLYDDVTGQQVRPRDVIEALEKYAPKPVSGGDTKVYHATDSSTANMLLKRGLIPETKPRPRTEEFEYAPGRGIDTGLYVGAGPREVSGYGSVTLEIVVPKKFLEVPTELAQLGETDAMRALRNHDGAIINHRLPPDAFRILPDKLAALRLAALKLALKVAARHQAAEVTLGDIQNLADDFGVGINLPAEGQAFSWDDNDSLADALLDDDTSLSPDALPAVKVAARYQEKKKVPKANGKGTTEVYVYSDKQVEHRNREKAKRLEAFKGKVEKLRSKVKADLGSKDRETRLIALAIALIDETHERVGNDESAKGKRNDSGEPHYGVTGFKKKHITLGSGSATIRYVGKSGVKQEKTVSTPYILSALRRAYKEAEGKDGCLFTWDDGSVTATKVNEFLAPFDITAKDLRGLAANALCQKALKKVRSKGGTLPEDKKEREEQLKSEFKEALEEVSDELGHEASTLKSQYLAPSMEREYLRDGTVIEKLHEKKATGFALPPFGSSVAI